MLLDALPAFVNKIVIVLLYHLLHQRLIGILLVALYLQQQTFLQRACSHTCGLELLQHAQHLLHLRLRCLYALVYLGLVYYLHERLAQEPVAIQLAYQILQKHLLALRQVEIGNLCLQLVVERQRVAVFHVLRHYLAVRGT